MGKSLPFDVVVDEAAAFLAGAAAFFPFVAGVFLAGTDSDSAVPPASCAATVPATDSLSTKKETGETD